MAYQHKGDEVLVNTRTIGNQGGSKITRLTSGGYVVLWRDNGAETVGQIFDADGNKVGSEFVTEEALQVAALPGGGFVTIWGFGEVLAQIYDSGGSPVGSPFTANTTTGGQYPHSVAALASGEFVIVWSDSSIAGDGDLRAQRFSADGTRAGPEFVVNTEPVDPALQFFSEVKGLAGGGFVVTWESEGDIKAQIFSSTGAKVGGEFQANSSAGKMVAPQVTDLAGGGFAIVWTEDIRSSDGFSEPYRGIYAQIFDSSGNRVGEEIRIAEEGPGQGLWFDAGPAGEGFVVTWQTSLGPVSDGSGKVVKAQVIDDLGNAVGVPLVVNSTTNGDQQQPVVTGLPSGDFVISWSDLSESGGDTDGAAVRLQTFQLAESIGGTAGDDVLSGTSSGDEMFGFAGDDELSGGDGADSLDGGSGDDLIRGGAGVDTLFVSGAGNDRARGGSGSDTLVVDYSDSTSKIEILAGLSWNGNLGGIDGAYGDNAGHEVHFTSIEQFVITGGTGSDEIATGDGDDVIFGGAGNDALDGAGGSDTLDGGTGRDWMSGGTGHDLYIVDNAGDTLVEEYDSGIDTVHSSVDYILGANLEHLVLLAGAVRGTGNAFGNVIAGNSANNILDGGANADTMSGGAGNDIYIVDSPADTVKESEDGGIDHVFSSTLYTLPANVENLTLTGTLSSGGYGNALNNIIDGNSGDNYLDGRGGADTLAGGAGDDTYFVDNAGDKLNEEPGAGTDTVHSSVSHVLRDNFENLVLLAGAVIGTGNALDNMITGNGGNNKLDGGTGEDWMAGGAGHDSYVVDDPDDVIVEGLNGGNDSVKSDVNYTLPDNVEYLGLIGFFAINGTGNALNNIISGNDAANVIDGKLGADFMTGGGGDDTYVVDNASDKVTEAADGGIDSVRSGVSWTLSANVERLTLTGTAAINGTGNDLANDLVGNAAANRLDGRAGTDWMQGGLGNDTYIVDNEGDLATDTGGVDTVQSSVTFTLHASIDNLILTGAAAIDGTGNDLWNVMTGNSAANTLDGGNGNDVLDGGRGADTLIGGAGHDKYFVDNVGDQIVDTGGGNDHVHSSISYTLGSTLEYLTLTGTAAINGTGNAQNNLIYGNAANNIIDGKLGADFMVGGKGDDTYYVENGSDQITEHLNQGTDTVMSSVHHALRGNIENLTLIGTNAVSATGNELANVITGNSANNVLSGGLGADTLSGGGGNDIYRYRSTAESTAAAKDRIEGFNAGDRIDLSGIDAVASTAANNDAFTFIGANAFSNTAGELRATQSGGVWTIEADVNGDGLADLVIGVGTQGGHMIGAADFIL